MADFWVVGPIAWDRVLHVPCLPPSGGFVQASQASERPGGSGANAAIALASTGVNVHMVGYVGDDEQGARLRAVLDAAGVDVGFVHARDGHTSEVVILVEPRPSRRRGGLCATASPMSFRSGNRAHSARGRRCACTRWLLWPVLCGAKRSGWGWLRKSWTSRLW